MIEMHRGTAIVFALVIALAPNISFPLSEPQTSVPVPWFTSVVDVVNDSLTFDVSLTYLESESAPLVAYMDGGHQGQLRASAWDGRDWTVRIEDGDVRSGQWSQLAVGPNGTAYLAYSWSTTSANAPDEVRLATTTSNGTTVEVVYSSTAPQTTPPILDLSLAVDTEGSLHLAVADGGIVYGSRRGQNWSFERVFGPTGGVRVELAIGCDGAPWIASIHGNQNEVRLSRPNGSMWQTVASYNRLPLTFIRDISNLVVSPDCQPRLAVSQWVADPKIVLLDMAQWPQVSEVVNDTSPQVALSLGSDGKSWVYFKGVDPTNGTNAVMYARHIEASWDIGPVFWHLCPSVALSAWADVNGNQHLASVNCEGSRDQIMYASTIPLQRANTAPSADLAKPAPGVEGDTFVLDASASSDLDGDLLMFRWDFDADGNWDTSWSPLPTTTYSWGDDWTGSVCIEVSDNSLIDSDCVDVAVNNIAPAISVSITPSGDEADSLTFRARATDPGSDDLTVTWWGHCTGWTPPTVLFNDPSIGTDPDPSPDIHPRDEVLEQTVVCGDDGTFDFNLRVEDDDAGETTVGGTFDVSNLPPSLAVPPPVLVPVDEGTAVMVSATASDPGSDDLTFTWTWQYGPTESRAYFNDGTGPDLDLSPDGTFPFTASDGSSFTYGDDGTYLVTLVVHDDDGASITYTTMVQVRNVAPTVDAGLDGGTIEATAVSFTFTFSDPGFDQPAAGTVEDFTATVDWGYGPSESFPVVEVPGGPGVPTVGTIQASHVYGDNGAFVVTVTVCDDDGGCGSDTMVVSVANVDPVIDDVQAYVVADLRVRVAGEKWHDVRMDLVWNDQVTGSARVVRYPGSPDDQSATVEGGRIQLLGAFRITLYYTPDDDPVNGQPNGANPVWVIITLPSGQEVWLHHTFNVRHPATWVWTLDDVRPYLVGEEITFEASASDVGSDDLTFAWSFGDGARASATYFNDGVAPDPFPSPEVNPIGATDVTGHVFGGAGTSTVMLTVTDDDGGTVTRIFTISVG